MQILREYEVVEGRNEPWWKIVFWWGAFHGTLRALLGTLLYAFFYTGSIGNVLEALREVFPWRYDLGEMVLALSLRVLVAFVMALHAYVLFVLVPSVLGGGAVTWILLVRERSHKLCPKEIVITGCLAGGAAGLAVIGLIQVIVNGGFVELWPSIMGASILVGACHSWYTAQQLSYRVQPPSQDQTIGEE